PGGPSGSHYLVEIEFAEVLITGRHAVAPRVQLHPAGPSVPHRAPADQRRWIHEIKHDVRHREPPAVIFLDALDLLELDGQDLRREAARDPQGDLGKPAALRRHGGETPESTARDCLRSACPWELGNAQHVALPMTRRDDRSGFPHYGRWSYPCALKMIGDRSPPQLCFSFFWLD